AAPDGVEFGSRGSSLAGTSVPTATLLPNAFLHRERASGKRTHSVYEEATQASCPAILGPYSASQGSSTSLSSRDPKCPSFSLLQSGRDLLLTRVRGGCRALRSLQQKATCGGTVKTRNGKFKETTMEKHFMLLSLIFSTLLLAQPAEAKELLPP